MATLFNYNTDFAPLSLYNVICDVYGMKPGSSADATSALQSALIDALEGQRAQWQSGGQTGGILYIPPGTYTFKGNIPLDASTYPDNGLIIQGVGGTAEFLIDIPTTATSGDFLTFTGFNSGRGIRFKNIRFTYSTSGKLGTAITSIGSMNVTCDQVYFFNCPTAFLADNGSTQCGLQDCSVDYERSDGSRNMVDLEGSQCFVRGCVMRQPSGGATDNVGIFIGSVSTSFVSDCHLSHFDYGIELGPNGREALFNNVRIDAGVQGVFFNPNPNVGDMHSINNVLFSDCIFYLSSGTTGQQKPGILVDTGGIGNAHVQGIVFNNCISYGWGGSGLQINSGSDIMITGGQYAGNANNPASSDPYAAGIEITGGVHITITGSNCSGVNQNIPSQTQPYGASIYTSSADEGFSLTDVTITGCVIVTNSKNGVIIAGDGGTGNEPTNISIKACDLTGNGSGAITFSQGVTVVSGSNVSNVQVADCAGYNDLGALLTAPASGTVFYNYSLGGYYGPIAFYVDDSGSGVSHIEIDGNNVHLTEGAFTLQPQENAKIVGTATHTLAIGK